MNPQQISFGLSYEVARGDATAFELWRWGVSPMFNMDAADRAARSNYGIKGASYVAIEADASSSTSSATHFDRSRREIARSGLDCVLALTYRSGGFALKAEGRQAEVQTGDVCLLDMTRSATLHTTAFTHVAITFSRSMIEPLVADMGQLHTTVVRRGTPINTLIVNAMNTFFEESPNLSPTERYAASHGMALLIAAAVGPSNQGRSQLARASTPSSLNVLRRTIEAQLANPNLGPDLLIRQHGVSRATLYRMFEPLGGVSHYILQRRLSHAYQILTTGTPNPERIGILAHQFGFTSSTVFSRAFKKTFDILPTDLRATVHEPNRQGGAGTADNDAFAAMHRSLTGAGIYVR